MASYSRLTALLVAAAFTFGVASAGADEAPAPADPVPAAPVTPPVAPAQAATPAPAAAAPIAAVDEKHEDIPRPKYRLCIGFGAAAVAAVIVGGVLGGLAKTRSDEQEGSVGKPPLYTPALASRATQGSNMADVAYAMFAVGGALGIADIVLWVERLRPARKPKAADKASLDGARLYGSTVKPTLTPGPMSLRVSF